MTFMVFLTS